MFLKRQTDRLKEQYQKKARKDVYLIAEDERDNPCAPNQLFIANLPKSDRVAHPWIGIIRRAGIYSPNLNAFCNTVTRCNRILPDPYIGNKRSVASMVAKLSPHLVATLHDLMPSSQFVDPTAVVEFSTAIDGEASVMNIPAVREIHQFITNLSSFLNKCYSPRSDRLEPFQKQLIAHTLYFLISIKVPELTNRLFIEFREFFGLFDTSIDKLQAFKQKTSVFLIPRRHGKTWIVVAIIATILLSLKNVSLGYVAHQKHVANSVFSEIINVVTYWGDSAAHLDIKKESGTISYSIDGDGKSTLMCATCFNKNVSMRRFFLISWPIGSYIPISVANDYSF